MAVRLLGPARRELIMRRLREHGMVRVDQLAVELDVSHPTIRRDINLLVEDGVAVRVYGGAVPPRKVRRSESLPMRLGLVIPDPDYFWPQVHEGVAAELARRSGVLVTRVSSNRGLDTLRLTRQLVGSAEVNGIIVAPPESGPGRTEFDDWVSTRGRTPIVYIERPVTDPRLAGVSSVRTDRVAGTQLAIDHLTAMGHRHLALIVNPAGPGAAELTAAWRAARAAHGDDSLILPGPAMTDPTGGTALHAVITQLRSAGVTGVVVHGDPQALALLQACHDRGISVPGELSVVAHDDVIASLGHPRLTSISPPKQGLGRIAVRLIADLLTGAPDSPSHVLLWPTVVTRESTAPVPKG